MTIKIKFSKVIAESFRKPAGYLDRMISLSQKSGDNLAFTPENYLTAIREFSPELSDGVEEILSADRNKIVRPLPRSDWPLWASFISLVSTHEDAGIGDTIARVIGPIGGDAFKQYAAENSIDCGCNNRQAWLNARFPL